MDTNPHLRSPDRRIVRSLALAALLVLSACGTGTHRPAPERLPPDYVPFTIGAGAAYRPPAVGAPVRDERVLDGLRCARVKGPRFGAHLEMFAHQHVVAIPAGIGITPPLRTDAAGRVVRGRCYYPVLTTDPTGVLEISARARLTLGSLFDLWGQPLSRHRIGALTASGGQGVVAFLGTRRWRGDPRSIPLGRHTRVVLELDSHVIPHRQYDFPPGL